jgi:hypothetical protein
MGILTSRKVTIRRQLVVPSSSSDDDPSLVKHDTRVYLNPSARENPLHPGACFHVGLASAKSAALYFVRVVGWSRARQSVDS